MNVLISVSILSILVEGIVEYFISKEGVNQPWLKYVAAGVGALVCILYQVDLFANVGLVSNIPFVGSILTGLIVGRGSNYLNDFVSKINSL